MNKHRIGRMLTSSLLLAALLLSFSTAPAFAAGGADTTFSGDGLAKFGTLESAPEVLVDSLNRVYVGGVVVAGKPFAGTALLIRYKANGGLDTSFSGDGKIYLNARGPVLGLEFVGTNVLVLMEDRLASIKPSGAFNSAFDLDGQALLEIPMGGWENDPLAVGNGFIYVLRRSGDETFVDQYAGGGMQRSYRLPIDHARAITVHDQTLYAAGLDVTTEWPGSRAVVTSLSLPSLTLNTGFGGGTAYGSLGSRAEDVLVSPGSLKVTIVGMMYTCPGDDCSSYYAGWAMRFLSNGSPDTFYDDDGEADLVGAADHVIATTMQSGGRVVIGFRYSHAEWGFGVRRLTSSGQVDPSFQVPDFHTLPRTLLDDITTSHGGSRLVVVGRQYTVRYLG